MLSLLPRCHDNLWLTALVAYSVLCFVLGRRSTPLTTGIFGLVSASLVAASAQMPWTEAGAFLAVPLAGGWLMASFLHLKLRAQDAAGGACASLCGVVGLVFESWIAMMLTVAVTLLVIRAARRWPDTVTIVSIIATTITSAIAAVVWTKGM
jgi:hypothetical protein